MTPRTARRLRRSTDDRIGAGVAGGLGRYFDVDPVLFRVLFATAAFFGGAGILAYLIAWAAIPDEQTERAPIDGWVASLVSRRVPFWAVVAGGALLFWLVAFSWWAPGPFLPVVAVVIVLVFSFGRRTPTGVTAGRVDLTKDAPARPRGSSPSWSRDASSWLGDARARSQERSRRAFPVRMAVLLSLVATLVTLGLVDAATGVALPAYFWAATGIIVAGLLVGLVLRRTPWGTAVLLVPAIAGLIAFAGSHATLRDGSGQRTWTPTTSLDTHYGLAFGRSTLDLRSLSPSVGARTVRLDQAAGQVRILVARTADVTVVANVHAGVVTVDGEATDQGDSGYGLSRTVTPLTGASGPAITIDIHLADGRVDVVRR